MSNFACKCGDGFGNLGLPKCAVGENPIFKDIFVPTFAADGTKNKILSTDLVDGKLPESFVLGKLNASNPADRWYPTPVDYEELNPSRTDRIQQTTARGTIYDIWKGVSVFEARLIDVPFSFASEIEKGKCIEMSVYHVSSTGELMGEVSDDGTEFFPRRIQKNSLTADSYPATDTEKAYTLIRYQLDRLANEGNFLTLSGSEVDLRELEGLIPVTLSQGSTPNTTTLLYIDARIKYGSFNNQEFVGKSDVGDWNAVNADTDAVLTLSGVTESPEGTYELTLSAPLVGGSVKVNYVETRTSVEDKGYASNTLIVTTP